MKDRESFVVVRGGLDPQGIVEKTWKEFVAGLWMNLERMREQPKKPPIPDDEQE